MSTADWYLVQAIASGLPFYTAPDADANTTILRHVTTETMPFLIYDDKPIVVPAVGIPSAAALMTSLRRMSEFLQDQDGYVRGYIRACTIAFGKVQVEGAANAQSKRYFTAGFETSTACLPNPGGYNPLWQLLKLAPSSKASADYEQCWQAMTSFDGGDYLRCGVVTAALYSLGVSAVFHSINISGRELNAWANGTPSVSTNLLENLFTKPNDVVTIPLNLAAAGFAQQVTKSVLSPDCFTAINFCRNWVGQAALNDNTGWRQSFGLKIPYIYEPLSLQWILQKWPSLYGYSGIGPQVNLGVELIMSEVNEGNQFSIWQGDSKYLEVAASSRPYLYIPYGMLLCNTILQDLRVDAMPPFAFTPIYKSGGERAAYGPQLVNDVALQPEFYAQIFSIKVGALTYDHARGCVLGPVWLREQLPDQVWEFLTRQSDWKAAYAGFMGGPKPERIVSRYSIGMVSDLIVGGASRSAGRRGAPEEEEN
nr:MAG: putative capsid protein [Hanko totivirus 9]